MYGSIVKKIVLITCAILFFAFQNTPPNLKTDNLKPPAVNIVFCIDLSGSSNSLITYFRSHIWDIFNDFDNYTPYPDVKLAIMVYGRPSLGKRNSNIKIITDFTQNIDTGVVALYKFYDNVDVGGEYVGVAIKKAVEELSWSSDPNTEKHIFMLGNGPANNGRFGYKEAGKLAQKQNIHIHSIYFKTKENLELEEQWKEIAELNNGTYTVVDTDEPDILFYKHYLNDLFLEMADLLNKTYIPYELTGHKQILQMHTLDSIALEKGIDVYESRCVYKASEHNQSKYNNWDLVDYYAKNNHLPKKIDTAFLPLEFKKYDDFDLIELVQMKQFERSILCDNIKILSIKRLKDVQRRNEKLKKFRVVITPQIAIIHILQNSLKKYYEIKTYKETKTNELH